MPSNRSELPSNGHRLSFKHTLAEYPSCYRSGGLFAPTV